MVATDEPRCYWWCPECEEEVSPQRVTFDERHDHYCNAPVEHREECTFCDGKGCLTCDYEGWLEPMEAGS